MPPSSEEGLFRPSQVAAADLTVGPLEDLHQLL